MTNNTWQIKSYSRTIGKNLTVLARSLLQEQLPLYHINNHNLTLLDNLHVEIGCGDGAHIYNMALGNPDANFLAIEAYLNGICNLLKLCASKPLKNLFIYPGDADLILPTLANNSVKVFYIFFPDPWPKTKQQKRRFLNRQRIDIIKEKLCNLGHLKFITDVKGYFTTVIENLEKNFLTEIESHNFDNYFEGYSPTKYHQKALSSGAKIFAMVYQKRLKS